MTDPTSETVASLVEQIMGLRKWGDRQVLYRKGLMKLSPKVLSTAIKLISNSPESAELLLYPSYAGGSLSVDYPTTKRSKEDDLRVKITDQGTDWGKKFFETVFSDPVPDLYLEKGAYGRADLHDMGAGEVKDLLGMLLDLQKRVAHDERQAHYKYAEFVRKLGTKRVPLVEAILDRLYP